MKDFTVPVPIFREYAAIMKGINTEAQTMVMKALGMQPEDPATKVTWDSFMKLNSLLRYETASLPEYVEFFCLMINPERK